MISNTKVLNFLKKLGVVDSKIRYGLSSNDLHQICVDRGLGIEAESGALAVNTGEFTGRSPKDRFIVKDDITRDKIWWGDINIPFSKNKFESLYKKVVKHISNKELFVRDAYACSDSRFRVNIRIITELPWVNIFSINMFLRPKKEELENFSPEWTIIQAPSFIAVPSKDGTRKHNFSIINFKDKIILIGGTGYTGEVKKGVFSVLNFILPDSKETLPMHCSANVGDNNETAIFFGLSGTGKTTLSADPTRRLIGDDEHGWSKDNVIFNFEGGCYAKVIDIKEEKEPDIYNAIKKGALLENVIFKKDKSKVDYTAGGFIDYYGYPYCRGRIFDSLELDNGQYDQNIDIFWASGACFFIKKEVFNNLKGFDENFYCHMEEIDLCWRITNFNSELKKRFMYKSVVYHLGGGSLAYNDSKKLFYNIRNHYYMVTKNIETSDLSYFFGFSRLSIINQINMLLLFYYLITFKFKSIWILFKLLSSSGFAQQQHKYFLLSKNNNTPRYYVIKSIIYNYLILKKRKYSQLNKS
jgi:GT2 family glycosyltransferase